DQRPMLVYRPRRLAVAHHRVAEHCELIHIPRGQHALTDQVRGQTVPHTERGLPVARRLAIELDQPRRRHHVTLPGNRFVPVDAVFTVTIKDTQRGGFALRATLTHEGVTSLTRINAEKPVLENRE